MAFRSRERLRLSVFVLVRLVVVPLLRSVLRRSRECVVVFALPPPRADRRTSPTASPPPLDSRRGRRGAAATGAENPPGSPAPRTWSDAEPSPAKASGGGVRERDAHVAKTATERSRERNARRLRVQRLGANVRWPRAAKAFQRVHLVARRRSRGSPLPLRDRPESPPRAPRRARTRGQISRLVASRPERSRPPPPKPR